MQDVRGKYGSEGDYVMNAAAARTAESDGCRSFHRYLRHDRLAGEEHSGEQRQGRHPWDLLRRISAADGAGESASGVEGGGADEPDGGWLDGRRLVSQRRVPPAELPYIYEQEATRDNSAQWWTSHFDDYDVYMEAGSAGELARQHGLEQIGFWRKLLEHPSYDAFWQRAGDGQDSCGAAVEGARDAGAQPVGPGRHLRALAVYKAIKPKDTDNDKVFLVMGPWHHGQEIGDGSTLGAIEVRQRYRAVFPGAHPAAISGAVSEGRRAARRTSRR